MAEITFKLLNEQATVSLGAALARLVLPRAKRLQKAVLIALHGDLGAGKTTFCRGFLNALGYEGAVKSPTYTIVEDYAFQDFSVYHFDFYRIADPEELEYMGIRDYFSKTALCLVEWPEKAAGSLPLPDLALELQYDGNARMAVLKTRLLSYDEMESVNGLLK